MSTYYVDKRTGTSADTLLAAGVARLVNLLLIDRGKPSEVRIEDKGPHYLISSEAPVEEDDIAAFGAQRLIQHLDTASQKEALGQHYGAGFDYDRQRQRRDEYSARRKELPPEARRPDAVIFGNTLLEEIAGLEPDTLLPLYLVINQMKVTPSFNEPVLRWRELPRELVAPHIRLVLDLFSAQPNPLEQTVARWEQLSKAHSLGAGEMTMLQVINPTTGKGAARTKANNLTIGGQSGFWLLELLKFAGFFMLAHPQTITKTKDRKTYVLRPRSIAVGLIDRLMKKFRQTLWSSTPAKLDILATLRFTQIMIAEERSALLEEYEQQRLLLDFDTPSERIHGFDVTFYKDMGSAFAVMNIAALNLPGWVPAPASAADADRLLALLKEHIDVVSAIRGRKGEERTDEYELLRRYRDFLSGRSLEPFLDFAALFAPYLSHKIERGDYIKRFSVDTLKELIAMTQPDLAAVVANQGFRNIANAIRRSTVSLQFLKGMGKQPRFEIRYGLAQELVRHSDDPDDFIAALSDFVTRYNNETAQKFETSKGELRRARVTEDDLEALVQLVAGGVSVKTLARLLVAFGSAKTSDDQHEAPPSEGADIQAADDESE